ncbi:MAG: FAD:protein FMN transferase [Alphaproteobacteria bacterium]
MSAPRRGSLTRRRVLGISAAITGLGLVMPTALARAAAPAGNLHVWRGVALGADAMLILHDDDSARARRLIDMMLHEIARLEAIFSLYRADSALVRLNTDGRLDAPPLDLVRLLELCRQLHHASGGAFDPTVQPLWVLLRRHFESAAHGAGNGPPAADLAQVRERLGFAHVECSGRRIAFARAGMGLTLNGIAQGYIADRVCDLLYEEGVARALIDLGEARALGEHPSGRPWRAAIPDPTGGTAPIEVPFRQGTLALATSSPYGTCFDSAARFTHLFDPASGESQAACRSVSVTAASAADADGLSTALAVRPDVGARLIPAWPNAGARLLGLDGSAVTLGDWPAI